MLLRIRCAVLTHNGYDAHPATVPDGYERLRTGNFDLVVISSSLVSKEASAFYGALPEATQTLLLGAFTAPAEMLIAVAALLRTPGGTLGYLIPWYQTQQAAASATRQSAQKKCMRAVASTTAQQTRLTREKMMQQWSSYVDR